jgi:hypothetical protein
MVLPVVKMLLRRNLRREIEHTTQGPQEWWLHEPRFDKE